MVAAKKQQQTRHMLHEDSAVGLVGGCKQRAKCSAVWTLVGAAALLEVLDGKRATLFALVLACSLLLASCGDW